MNETTNNQKVTYDVNDINKAILLLDSIPHTGIETSKVIVEIATILQSKGKVETSDSEDTETVESTYNEI